jgi:integrase
MKLTESNLPKIKRAAAGKNDYVEWDEALPGFGLRIRGGKASWVVQYKLAGQQRRISLGSIEMLTADEARNGWTDRETGERRKGARQILADAHDGIDYAISRATRRAQAAQTVGVVVASYLEAKQASLRPRSHLEVTRHLGDLWRPIHGLPVDSVTRAVVATELNAIAKRSGPTGANRARASLSAFFAWAMGEGLCSANPVVGTNKQEENDPRQRILIEVEEEHGDDQPRAINWSEMVSLWQALREDDYGNIVKLLALTGCRRDEIGSLQWSEIDFDKRLITIPGSRTKNGTEHKIPLSALALSILQAVPRRDREHVFGLAENGFSGWSKAKTALDKRVKLRPWTLHDIRRTVRSGLGALAVEPHIAEAVLNHLPTKLVRTYDVNPYLREKRAALDLWASEMDVAIRKANGENVTSLRRA